MIAKKLRSRTGASLIAALFLFLFCAMTGTVILTATSANAGRLARRHEIDRDYYRVTSAAKLFAEQLEGKTVELKLQRKFTYYPENGTTDETFSGWGVSVKSGDSADAFSVFLANAVREVYGASPDRGKLEEYWGLSSQTPTSMIVNGHSVVQTLTMTSTISGDNAPVYVRMTLQGDDSCALRAVFSSAAFVKSGDSFRLPNNEYFVQLIVRTEMTKSDTPDPSSTVDEEITNRTVTLTWENAQIQILEGK